MRGWSGEVYVLQPGWDLAHQAPSARLGQESQPLQTESRHLRLHPLQLNQFFVVSFSSPSLHGVIVSIMILSHSDSDLDQCRIHPYEETSLVPAGDTFLLVLRHLAVSGARTGAHTTPAPQLVPSDGSPSEEGPTGVTAPRWEREKISKVSEFIINNVKSPIQWNEALHSLKVQTVRTRITGTRRTDRQTDRQTGHQDRS